MLFFISFDFSGEPEPIPEVSAILLFLASDIDEEADEDGEKEEEHAPSKNALNPLSSSLDQKNTPMTSKEASVELIRVLDRQ